LEAGVAKVLDPLGGSYFVETLTDQISERIRGRVDEIEARGDPEELSAGGFFRDIFHRAMEDSQHDVEHGDISVVGVNVHKLAEQDDTLLRDVATAKIETWRRHIRTIEAFKRERDLPRLLAGLDGVAVATAGSANLVPAVIDALDASATIGEIVTTMRRTLAMPPDMFDHPLPGPNVGARHVA
jgi:methylmalonyl-CoA mutase N-terminal domain/subunit